MTNNFVEITKKFKEINSLGYIKGINNLTNSCGLTFEKLLGKNADSMFFPDFKGIEIKTTTRFSRYPITLFTTSFDGPNLFESNYLLETYGKKDIVFKDKKILIINLKLNKKVNVYNKYYFKLILNHTNERIQIDIYDINDKFIESRAFIDFKTMENKLKIKLSNMALVFASKKKVNDDLYFRYYRINCYELIDFKSFIDLIEKEKIKFSLSLRISRSGIQNGKVKNKNMILQLDKDSIDKLFNKIYEYEK